MNHYALLSVFDKTGIVELAKTLVNLGYTIISTGGTAKTLMSEKIPVVSIQDITGNPESFDGRMKTISFQVESGILFDRNNSSHVQQAKDLNIEPIDIVVCNLYPFEKTVAKESVTLKDVIENIDVGGPTMIRSAAKNFQNVLVVVDPLDYREIQNALQEKIIHEDYRKKLAAKAFSHLSFYDSQIAQYLSDELFPQETTIPGRKILSLRYGENPHQKGAVYSIPNASSPYDTLEKKWGRELSLINLTDVNAGIEAITVSKTPGETTAVIIKHNSPCGIALGKTPEIALKRAIDSDPESAFGGVIVLNSELDIKTARIIGSFKDEKKANIDIIAVLSITTEALEYLKTVRKSMGIYTFAFGHPAIAGSNFKFQMNVKWIRGGFIMQTEDTNIEDSFKEWLVVTKKKPTKQQFSQMKIAWKFISRIRSNAIIVVDKTLPMTRGIGSGQTSRVRSTKIALEQAGVHTKGALLASDSFFPFDDSVKLAVKQGISAIIQQGGSVNDKASIDAADKAGITMVFTHRRAFWH